MTLFRKIRERRLFQVALSFVGGAWVALEVSDQLVDRGVIPELVYQILLMWVVVGVPAALMIGWFHGEKGDQKAPRIEIAALTVLALIGIGLSLSKVSAHRAEASTKAASENVLETRRVAVMYFHDATSDHKYEHIADGLTESLIDALSQVNDLHVISRNGSAQFRDSDLSPDSIAQLLGAGTLVEGTVEEKGDKIRVSVSLVDGESGATIGRPFSIERSADDPVALKDSIAAETAVKLRSFLGDQIRLKDAARNTNNSQAWLALQRAEKLRKNAEAAIRQGDATAAQSAFAEAEAMLAQAEKMDPAWPDPAVARAVIAYRQSRLLQRTSPTDALASAQKGLAAAEEALSRSKTNARALEMRGTLNYWIWLMKVTPDPAAQEKLLLSARKDLEEAVQYDASLASADATLSHLYLNVREMPNVLIAAQRAYTTDAYLEVADVVLWRLFTGSWQLHDFTAAIRWCETGSRRFPNDYRFTSCGLRNLITPATEPDIDHAWKLLTQLDSLTPPNLKAAEHARGELLVAGVIARRAGRESGQATVLRDSANAVINRVSQGITPELDPTGEVLTFLGVAHVLAGNQDQAIGVLERIKARDPVSWGQGKGEVDWYWTDLRSHPKFATLFDLK